MPQYLHHHIGIGCSHTAIMRCMLFGLGSMNSQGNTIKGADDFRERLTVNV